MEITKEIVGRYLDGMLVAQEDLRPALVEGGPLELKDTQRLHQAVFYGVKAFANANPCDEGTDVKAYWDLINSTVNLIALLTPREFMTIFPIDKDFDGERFEMKDYFYTMQIAKDVGLDTPIINAFNFLWDYYNRDTRHFMVHLTGAIDMLGGASPDGSVLGDLMNRFK